MKIIIKSFIILMLCNSLGFSAQGYYALSKSTTTGKATMHIAGDINVAVSSATIETAIVTLDGDGIRVGSGATVSTITADGFYGNVTGAASLNVLKTGDTMTGNLVIPGGSVLSVEGGGYSGRVYSNRFSLLSGADYAFSVWQNANSWLDNDHNFGIGNQTPAYKLDVTGGIRATSSMTASAYYGDGSNLTGIPVDVQSSLSTKVDLTETSSVTISNALGVTGDINTAENYQIDGADFVVKLAGAESMAIGVNAGLSETGGYNTFIGQSAGSYNAGGQFNSYVGRNAGIYNITGSQNTVLGESAGAGVSGNSYSNNSLFGYRAGLLLTTGGNNVLLGYNAGNSLTNGAGNIIIGYDQDTPTATTSNHLNIGGLIVGTIGSSSVTVQGGLHTNTLHATGAVTLDDDSFSVGGSTLNINNGRVGIGQSVVDENKLEVSGDIRLGGSIQTGSLIFGDWGTGADLRHNGVWRGSANSLSAGNHLNIQGYNGVHIMEGTGGFGLATERLTIGDTGNVGISTGTPQYGLDVNGTLHATGATTLDTTLSVLGIINTNNQWISGDGGAEGIYIADDGKVGISSSTPTQELSVTGDVNISGGYYANGVAVAGLGDAVLAADQTFTGENTFSDTIDISTTANFSNATSTTTFSGWIDIGYEVVTNLCTATACRVSCPTGKRLLSCQTISSVAGILQIGNDAGVTAEDCLVTLGASQTFTVQAICARVK